MADGTLWVIDTSSIITVRRQFSRSDQSLIREGMRQLVEAGRLVFPKQVLPELERYEGKENPALQWALENEARGTRLKPSLDWLTRVLHDVPQILDPDKDSGVEEADPYVLGLALYAAESHEDVRVITEESRDLAAKMALANGAGYLGLPSVSLRVFLSFEGLVDFPSS